MTELILAQALNSNKVVGQRTIIEEGSVSDRETQDLSMSGGASFVYALAAIGLLAIGIWAVKQFLAKPPAPAVSVTIPKSKVTSVPKKK
jgi:hypothetical protein